MKTLIFVAAISMAAGATAFAQEAPSSPLGRGDLHFLVGWQNLYRDQPQQSYDDWINNIIQGGAGAGWYWTDHLKTQVDLDAGSEGQQYRYETIVVNGQTTSRSSRVSVRQQTLTVAQQFQFFRNRWVHPHVGAGLDIARETTTEDYNAVVLYDSVSRTSREVLPRRTEGPEHRVIVRPFAAAGFKAYLTRRAFFAADARIRLSPAPDEVLFRAGFGVDF